MQLLKLNSIVFTLLLIHISRVLVDGSDQASCTGCLECEQCEKCTVKNYAGRDYSSCDECTFQGSEGSALLSENINFFKKNSVSVTAGPFQECEIIDVGKTYQDPNHRVCGVDKAKNVYVSCYNVWISNITLKCSITLPESGEALTTYTTNLLKSIGENSCPAHSKIPISPTVKTALDRLHKLTPKALNTIIPCRHLLRQTKTDDSNKTTTGNVILQWTDLKITFRSTLDITVVRNNSYVPKLDKLKVDKKSYSNIKLLCDGTHHFEDPCQCFLQSVKRRLVGFFDVRPVLEYLMECVVVNGLDDPFLNPFLSLFYCDPQ